MGRQHVPTVYCTMFFMSFFSVHIDGLEWQGVKFFQLSSHWQTHIKHFPIATFLLNNTHTAL